MLYLVHDMSRVMEVLFVRFVHTCSGFDVHASIRIAMVVFIISGQIIRAYLCGIISRLDSVTAYVQNGGTYNVYYYALLAALLSRKHVAQLVLVLFCVFRRNSNLLFIWSAKGVNRFECDWSAYINRVINRTPDQ